MSEGRRHGKRPAVTIDAGAVGHEEGRRSDSPPVRHAARDQMDAREQAEGDPLKGALRNMLRHAEAVLERVMRDREELDFQRQELREMQQVVNEQMDEVSRMHADL